MRSINFFVEDDGHEKFLKALVQRYANQYGIHIKIEIGNSTGGHGKVIFELKQYVRDLALGKQNTPDLLVVAIDGNSERYSVRKREIDSATKNFSGSVICAIPEPHIERWLLLDAKAFKKVLGKGCLEPIHQKSERSLYKRLLLESMRKAGVNPPQGGIEYAEDLVNAMDLEGLERKEPSLGKLLKSLREKFKEWQRTEQDLLKDNP